MVDDRKSRSPPCVCEKRRHKDGAPSVVMNERENSLRLFTWLGL